MIDAMHWDGKIIGIAMGGCLIQNLHYTLDSYHQVISISIYHVEMLYRTLKIGGEIAYQIGVDSMMYL